MAIDYGNYAQLHGAKPDLSGLSTAVDKFLNKRKEGIMMQANKMKDDTWGGYQNAFEDVLSSDVKGIDNGVSWAAKANSLTSKTAGQALRDYKAAAKLKGDKVYEMMEKNGQFEPIKFKEMYDSMIVNSMPGIERKLEDFQKNNFMSNTKMRQYIKDNNLQNFIQQYGSDVGPLKELSYDKQGFLEGLSRRTSDAELGATDAAFAGLALNQLRQGTAPLKNLKTLVNKDARLAKGADILGGKGRLGVFGPESKLGKGYEKQVTNMLESRKSMGENIVSKKQKAYDAALKKFSKNKTQKGLKPAQIAKNMAKSKAVGYKKAISDLSKAKNIATKTADKSAKGALSFIKNKIEKKGAASVFKEIVKKAGYKTAARLLGTGALSTVGTLSGIGTAAGVAGSVYTIYEIYNILTSD